MHVQQDHQQIRSNVELCDFPNTGRDKEAYRDNTNLEDYIEVGGGFG